MNTWAVLGSLIAQVKQTLPEKSPVFFSEAHIIERSVPRLAFQRKRTVLRCRCCIWKDFQRKSFVESNMWTLAHVGEAAQLEC